MTEDQDPKEEKKDKTAEKAAKSEEKAEEAKTSKSEEKGEKSSKKDAKKADKGKSAEKADKKADAKDAKADEEEKSKKKKKKSKRRSVPEGMAFVTASYNNTIVTLTDPEGQVIAWASAGSSGFKGTRKSTPYAAQIAAENAYQKATAYGLERVKVFVKGVGSGREQALRGLVSAGLEVTHITDTTGTPHNGCRPPSVRRT